MPAEQAYARAHDLLARVGLADRAEAYPDSMSGGEQRRVAVARALINAPPLLLADEPTSDLDANTEADIIDLLEDLQRKDSFGFVLVTHDLRLAARAQRSFEMRQGALTPRELPLARSRAATQRHARQRRSFAGRAGARADSARREPLARGGDFSAPPRRRSWPPSCLLILASRHISRCACASARLDMRRCSTWRSIGCAATCSRSPTMATASTN